MAPKKQGGVQLGFNLGYVEAIHFRLRRTSMASLPEIRVQASAFRTAIERCSGRLRSVSLKSFPRGSCGDVADMLGMYLLESLGINCEYVTGWLDRRSHAWLECDGIVIDITADQFDGNEPVIVTEDSPFHQRFEDRSRRLPDIYGACGEHLENLNDDFELLVATIEE